MHKLIKVFCAFYSSPNSINMEERALRFLSLRMKSCIVVWECHWPLHPVRSCTVREHPAASLQKRLCPLSQTWWAVQKWRRGWRKSVASSRSWQRQRSRRRTDTRRAGSRKPGEHIKLQMIRWEIQTMCWCRQQMQTQDSPHSYRRSKWSCWPTDCSTNVHEPGEVFSGVWSEI